MPGILFGNRVRNVEEKIGSYTLIKSMVPYARKALAWIAVGAAGGILTNVLVSFMPVMIGKAIDSALAIEESPGDLGLRWPLVASILAFLGIGVLHSACRVAKRLGFRYTENRVTRGLREAAFSHILEWPLARFSTTRVGDLMSRMVGDLEVMSRTVRRVLTEAFDTVVMMTVAFGILAFYNLKLTLLVAIPGILVVFLAQAAGNAVSRLTLAARTATGMVVAHLEEAISGIRVVRLLGCEQTQSERLEALTRAEVKCNLAAVRLRAGLMPACSVLAQTGTAAVILLGGRAVIDGSMSVGDFLAYLVLFARAIRRTLTIAGVLNTVHAGRAALRRTKDLLPEPAADSADAVKDRARKPRPLPQEMHISNLRFAYPGSDTPVLDGIDLIARPGQLIGVTGPVSSGKTALAKALLGLYPWLDGDTGNGDSESGPESLTGAVAYCPQSPSLFSGTVEWNIAFETDTRKWHPERIREAAHIASLEKDLALLPDGFDTLVGDGGVRVSGGQRQRIALARAIYASKKWLVLDDPFAAVDLETEKEIIERMRAHLSDTIILLLSHRLAAFPHADRVLVLDKGRVVEQGTHDDLMHSGRIYPAIYQAQLCTMEAET